MALTDVPVEDAGLVVLDVGDAADGPALDGRGLGGGAPQADGAAVQDAGGARPPRVQAPRAAHLLLQRAAGQDTFSPRENKKRMRWRRKRSYITPVMPRNRPGTQHPAPTSNHRRALASRLEASSPVVRRWALSREDSPSIGCSMTERRRAGH